MVHALCTWRDNQARRNDDSVQFVLPDPLLLILARSNVKSLAALKQLIRKHVDSSPVEISRVSLDNVRGLRQLLNYLFLIVINYHNRIMTIILDCFFAHAPAPPFRLGRCTI